MRNKRCIDLAKGIPFHSIEKGMGPDVFNWEAMFLRRNHAPYEVFRLMAKMYIVWKEKVFLPIDDLLVCVMSILRAEWWVSDKTFEHDGAERPPITLLAVALKEEDFGGNIIRCSNSRKSQLSTVRLPCCDLFAAGHGQMYWIYQDTITRWVLSIRRCLPIQQFGVVSRVMLFMETSR